MKRGVVYWAFLFIQNQVLIKTESSHHSLKALPDLESLLPSVLISHWNRREGIGHRIGKNETAQGYGINWLEPNRSKMADKSTSTRLWASVWSHCNTSANTMTVQATRQRPKRGCGGPVAGNPHPFPSNSWNNPTHEPMRLPSPEKLSMLYFEASLTF